MHTNVVGSIKRMFLILVPNVKDAFPAVILWQTYLNRMNRVTIYFKNYQKTGQQLIQLHRKNSVTNDLLECLKQNLPT